MSRSDVPFYVILGVIGGFYVAVILLMLLADLAYTSPQQILSAFRQTRNPVLDSLDARVVYLDRLALAAHRRAHRVSAVAAPVLRP